MNHKISIFTSDKNLYSIEDFKSFSKPIGIAIQTENQGMGISLEEWNLPWGDSEDFYVSESEAILRTSGYKETLAAYNQLRDKTKVNAITQCLNYNLGKMQWYMPCLQQLSLMRIYKEEINEILYELNALYYCDILHNIDYYWSSTQCSGTFGWCLFWKNGRIYDHYKDNHHCVRAVCDLYPIGKS